MTGNRKASLYKSRGRFSIAVRYVLERAKGICEDRINVNGTTHVILRGTSIKPLPILIMPLQGRMNTGFFNPYCVTANPIIWRGRKRSIRLRPLDYPTAKTETTVKDAKREVYP